MGRPCRQYAPGSSVTSVTRVSRFTLGRSASASARSTRDWRAVSMFGATGHASGGGSPSFHSDRS